MTSYFLLPLVTLITYLFLLTIVLRDTRTTVRRLFSVYLVASAGWSLSSFMVYANFFPGQLSLWGLLVPVTGLWAVVSYCQFICAFTHRRVITWIVLGYAFMAVLGIMAIIGYIPLSPQYSGGGEVNIYHGPWLYLMTIGSALFGGMSIFYLTQRYRALKDPLSRNRVAYLLIGVSLLVVFSIRIAVPAFPKYPVEHIGHLANALLISYAITKYKPLDIKLVLRKGLAYSSISVFITPLYLLMFWGLHYFQQTWTSSASIVAILAMTFVIAWLFNPLRMFVQRAVDGIFYGESYDYRQSVLSLAQKMSTVIELGELAETMLKPIAKAVNATQVSLLLSSNGDFTSQFAERLIEGRLATPIKLTKDSPIVSWLAEKDKPFSPELLDAAPEFKKLLEAERDIIEDGGIELLLPMKSKGKLVGILALSKKRSGGLYSSDDIALLMTLASQAAVAIYNAQLYAQARERAHIDDLTGLLNHGYFHERVDEEITKCSRFGDIFSLLFLDMDLFKAYNDIYGHLAGDDILRQIGQHIIASIRGIDMAFRYGGDEFAVILPQAPLDDAYSVAERIQKSIESEMDSQGVALTCSVGIASWPTDGVMREEVIQAADVALYHSKQAGRNRVSLASDVTPSMAPMMKLQREGEPGVLSTIHALAATVDAKDHHTYGHSKKASRYASWIAKALGYSDDMIATIEGAAMLHDIGKIRVPDTLLAKRAPLSNEDWNPIHAHPKLGVAILKHVESLSGCLAAIQYHHERYDGNGYPAGLKGDNIPLDARILAVADAYDAMTSTRPYRDDKLTHDQALAELKRNSGTQFDPGIVRVFVALWDPIELGERAQGLSRSASVKTGELMGMAQQTL